MGEAHRTKVAQHIILKKMFNLNPKAYTQGPCRIVVIDTFLGVGLQKVYSQFRYLLSSFFLLDRFIPNFGNLLNLISYSTTGYFRPYLFKFFFMYFFRNPHV